MPYEHPLAWRLVIAPADIFTPWNGAYIDDVGPRFNEVAVYSSASEADFFAWGDAHADNARQLAEKFVQRFPALCRRGKGRDWAYAGWLSELLGVLERNSALPVIMEEHGAKPTGLRTLPLRKYGTNEGDREFDLPPVSRPFANAVPAPPFDMDRPTLPRIIPGDAAKDLTQFGAVASLVGIAMAVGAQMFQARDEDAGHELLLPAAKALAGLDETYIVNSRWCEREALGNAVVIGLDLPKNLITDLTFEEVVLFGLEHVSLGVQLILQCTETTADWDGVTGPCLMEVHAFAACVFLGTAPTLYPGKTLESFLQHIVNRSGGDAHA